jgi:hypothetical protein
MNKPSDTAESILAIDFGSTLTRVMLFDVVEGQYCFIAAGTAPSTDSAPHFNVIIGANQAIRVLQSLTGRAFLDNNDTLIIPSQPDGRGVDKITFTVSTGKAIKVITAGLLPEVSLASLERLAATSYCQIVDSFGVDDRRSLNEKLDSILFHKPEIVLIAGGTEGGARRMVLKNVNLINIACRLLPKGSRPVVIYEGNRALALIVKEMLEKCTNVIVSSNINPSLDFEDIDAAEIDLSEIVGLIRAHQMDGLREITQAISTQAMPTVLPLGRMIRFFSRIYDPSKRVLGVDIGSRSTILSVAQDGKLWMNVSFYGNGQGVSNVMQVSSVDDITQWLSVGLPEDLVRDYLYNKTLYPASIPMAEETLAIEQALARHILHLSTQEIKRRYTEYNAYFDPIIASGSVLGQAPDPGQSLLMLLDGLQPIGVTTIALDQNSLVAALGAVSKINPKVPVQVIETSAFEYLGTVISPVSNERIGTPILNARLEYDDGGKYQVEINQGSIVSLPLRPKKSALLHLEPLRKLRIDPSRKRDVRNFKVVGGLCGVVVDVRGRPITLPEDKLKKREMLSKWLEEVKF